MNQFPRNVPIQGRVRICLELLKQFKPRGKVIVDVGSSFGWLEKQVERSGIKKMVGVEPNSEAVKFARQNARKAEFKVGNALNLPIKDSFADIVTLYDVIEHVPKGTEAQVLLQVHRVLKKSGILLLSTPFDHPLSKLLDLAWYFGHRHYSQLRLRQLLKSSGFKVLKIESRGSIFSSLYLVWFYLSKKLLAKSMPRNQFLENLDDRGFNSAGITDVFVVAEKIKNRSSRQ